MTLSMLRKSRLATPNRSSMKQVKHVLVEDLARQLVTEVLAGPRVVLLVLVVDALEEVGNPADAALGQRNPDVGELAEHRVTRSGRSPPARC